MNTNKILGAVLMGTALIACTDDTNFGPGKQEGYLYFIPTETHDWADGNKETRSGVEAPMRMECSLDGQPIYLHTEVNPTMSAQLEESLCGLDTAQGDDAETPQTRGVRYTEDVFTPSTTEDATHPKITSFGVYATRTDDRTNPIFNFEKITPTFRTESATGTSYDPYQWNVKTAEIDGVWDSGTADFYGYAPYFDSSNSNGLSLTASTSTGVPTLSYTVPSNVQNQLDILTAKHLNVPKGADVELEFTHIMSAIKFRFQYGREPDGSGSGSAKSTFQWSDGLNTYDITVTNIQIKNVYTTGTWEVGGDPYAASNPARWTRNANTTATFSYAPASRLSNGASTESSPKELNPDYEPNVFMMLPQQVPADAEIELTCSLTPSGESTATKTMTLRVPLKEPDGTTPKTWLPGYTYTYTLSLSDYVYVFDFDTSNDYVATTPSANATNKHPLEYTNVSYNGHDSYPLMIRSYKIDSKGAQTEVDWRVYYEVIEQVGNIESAAGTTPNTVEVDGTPDWVVLHEGTTVEAGDEVGATHGGALPDAANRNFMLEVQSIAESPVIDLSRYNYDQTQRWEKRFTANCYIVAGPGHYRIPLVYGNAISNGVDNPDAYMCRAAVANPSGSFSLATDAENHFLSKMLNHNGDYITEPYINKVTHASENLEAVLIWEETEDLITDFTVDFQHVSDDGYNADKQEGFLEFKVNPDVFNYGNAVIGVRAKGGVDIYWSWHIWITDPSTFVDNNKTLDIKDYHEVTFSSCNLGWVSAESSPRTLEERDGKLIFVQNDSENQLEIDINQLRSNAFQPYLTNTLYQWGRKDPMLGIDESSDNDTDDGTPRTSEDGTIPYVNRFGNKASVAEMIKNPNTIYSMPRGDLYTVSYINLWGMNCDKTRLTYNYYGKTIYDPCPVGYCVPPSKSFSKLNKRYRAARSGLFARAERSGFVEIAATTANAPVLCTYHETDGDEVVFPLAGLRTDDGGHEMKAHGFYGDGTSGSSNHAIAYYQTASPYSNDENWAMRLDVYTRYAIFNPADTHVGNFKPDHGSAGSVRPVRYKGENLTTETDEPDLVEPLTFQILSGGNIRWESSDALVRNRSLYYIKNNGEMTELPVNTDLAVNKDDIVQFFVYMTDDEDDVDVFYASTDALGVTRYQYFEPTANFKAYGNIMSLISDDYEGLNVIYNADTFRRLFGGNTGGYLKEFQTTDLNTGEVLRLRLPATTLQADCYRGMFYQCTAITDAPVLPATEMAANCYQGMFNGCTALVTPPALPATTLASNCYQGMFYGCTSLIIAPDLPAENLVSGCYEEMFSGCTNLNYVKALFTTQPARRPLAVWYYDYTEDWLNGVSASGTFVRNSSVTDDTWGVTNFPRNQSTVPSGWTIVPE